MKKAVYLAGLGVLLEVLFVLMAFSEPKTKIFSLFIPYMLAFLFYFASLLFLTKKEKEFFPVIIFFALVFRLTFLFVHPVLQTEVYRGVWDAEMQQHGFSPYELQPKHYSLNFLRDSWFTLMPFPNLYSYYGPWVQIFLYALSFISTQLFFFKFAVFLLDLLLLYVLSQILKAKEMDQSDLLLYAWNPLVVVEVAWHGSFWVLGTLLLFSSLMFYLRKSYASSAFFSGLAFSANPLTIFSLPLFMKRLKFLPVILLGFVPFAFFSRSIVHFLQGLQGYFSFENGYAFFLVDKFLPTKYILPILVGLLAAAVVIIYVMQFSIVKKSYLLTAFVLFLLPKLLPAFLLLLIPFLIFYRTKAILLFTMLVNFYYLGLFSTLFSLETTLALEYIPAVLLLVYGFLFKD